MKIKQAVKEARRLNRTISSEQAGMYSQSAKSLIGWLFGTTYADGSSFNSSTLNAIIDADDWTLDTINPEYKEKKYHVIAVIDCHQYIYSFHTKLEREEYIAKFGVQDDGKWISFIFNGSVKHMDGILIGN